MIHQAVKIRIYPKREQSLILAQHFGCARWWWNYALNKCIETYKQTGKGLTRSAMNSILPRQKRRGNKMVERLLFSSTTISKSESF